MSAVRELAPELVQVLIEQWPDVNAHRFPDGGYAMARGVAVELVYEEIVRANGSSVVGVDHGAPSMQRACDNARECIRNLPLSAMTPEHFGHVDETLVGFSVVSGRVAASGGRRRSGAHYTPPELAMKVVERTLEPLLKCISSQSPLVLKICDPAVGAGVFLLSVMRMLAPMVLERGEAATMDQAKRLVAIHCCHGVDRSRYAVHASKLALTLEARAWRMPRSWLDDNIKHGDALVGLNQRQIKAFDWREGAETIPELARLYDEATAQAVSERQNRVEMLARMATAP